MEQLPRYFWIALVIMTCANVGIRWSHVQDRIRENPDLKPGYRRLFLGHLFWVNLPWLGMGIGILSGQVPSVFEFLRPSEGNVFVLAWWGLLAALFGLGTWWFLVGGGAEAHERHPGVGFVPPLTARRIRIYWVCFLAWNVVCGTILFFGFPDDSWAAALIPVIVLYGLASFGFRLADTGGWRTLARHYVSEAPFSGKDFPLSSTLFGNRVGYRLSLRIEAGPQGLHLAARPLLRMSHPPLLIPWPDITACEHHGRLFYPVEFRFAKAPTVSVRFSRRTARALLAASGTQVQIQSRL